MPEKVTSGQLGMATFLGDLLGSSDADLDAEFAAYASLGVDWVRTDFHWGLVQPTANGAYNWSKLDKVVDTATKYGIKVIGILSDQPDKPAWVAKGLPNLADQVAYGKFAGAAAAHFKGKVNHWQITNEPNKAGIAPDDYTVALKEAYKAIKAVDSTDTVISGGLSPAPQTANGIWGAVDYLKAMYANGAKGYFDAVGFHPYTWPLLPDDPALWNGWEIMETGIRQTMVANGDGGLQIWMTEQGAPTWGGGNAVSEATQAKILQQSVDLAKQYSWAGPIMWYTYQDQGGSSTDTEKWFGMVTTDGKKKAAYYTYKTLASQDGGNTGTPNPSPTLNGDGNANTLTGTGGDDVLWGNGGNDTLYGGGGNDVLHGEAGNDMLWGNAGNDRFVFDNAGTMGWDRIRDFTSGDKIDLSAIDANANVAGNQAFTFIGSKWLSKPGDLGFYKDAQKGWTSIQGDLNGDKKYDFSIAVDGSYAFSASDFIL